MSSHPAASASAVSVRRSQDGLRFRRESVSRGRPQAAAHAASLGNRARAAPDICPTKAAGVVDVFINTTLPGVDLYVNTGSYGSSGPNAGFFPAGTGCSAIEISAATVTYVPAITVRSTSCFSLKSFLARANVSSDTLCFV